MTADLKLHTTDFSTERNDTFRAFLVENFEDIEKACHNVNTTLDEIDEWIKANGDETNKFVSSTALAESIAELKNTLISRIDRISRGTDYDTTYAVVLDILKDKGVIK